MSNVGCRMGAPVVGLALGGLLFLPFDLRPSAFDIAYAARHLACAAFLEDVRTEVDARRGLTEVRERGYRAGVFVVRAEPAGAALRFTAWYDSLTVRHESVSGMAAPDTDGLIGGRWRGTLTPFGDVSLTVRPFLPPEVRAVADLSDMPLDFLPPLPHEPVPAGGEWTGPDGLHVARLADSAEVARYRWRLETESEVPGIGPDSTVTLRQSSVDEGRFRWTDASGVIGWEREVRIGTRIRSGPRVGAAVRGEITQVMTVRRVPAGDRCR
jgi:hypothetical protein